jgi:uncharacterized protein YbjQ (UPF0145 family)
MISLRWLVPMLVCSMSFACAGQERRAETGGEHESGVDADHDDEKVPDDPATIAKAATVRIMETDDIGCPVEALGPVDVHKKMESTPQALESLKRRAAAMGADAVIHVEFEHGEGGQEPTHLAGMAVRCNDLIKGRAYDIIGALEVKGEMGKEERAYSNLLAKATAIHADLLIDVKFEHGEGGEEKPTVSGKAIKFRQGR